MRISYVSTYPPIECGIATYTQYLANEMRSKKKEVLVYSQLGAQGENVFPVYDPSDRDIGSKLFNFAQRSTPDIIHIQHEFGLFGEQRGIQVVDFLFRCKTVGVPVVTTFHTVFEDHTKVERMIMEQILKLSTVIIVHEKFQKEIIAKQFGYEKKVSVIPHGIRNCKPNSFAKSLLGLEGKKVILLAGYFRTTKGFDKVIELFPEVLKKVNNAVLLFAGRNRLLEHNEHKDYLMKLIAQSPARNRIKVLSGQFPQYTLDTILSAADVMAMNYSKGAQSGILAQAAAFDLPVVTSDLESFKLWNEEANGGLTSASDKEIVKNFCKILSDDDYAKILRQNIIKYKKKRLWYNIAQQHLNIYDKIISASSKDAMHFYIPEQEDIIDPYFENLN